MGIFDNVPEDKLNAVKKQHEDNKIKPAFQPGQGPIGGNSMQNQPGGNPFGAPSQPPRPGGNPFGAPPTTPPVGGSPFGAPSQPPRPGGNPFGAPGGNPFGAPGSQAPRPGGFNSGFGQNNQQAPQQPDANQANRTTEEKMTDAVTGGIFGVFAFFKELANSFKSIDNQQIREGSNRVFIISIAIGILTLILGFFKHNIWYITGAYIITIPTSMLFSYFICRFGSDEQQEPIVEPEPYVQQPPVQENPFSAVVADDDDDLYDSDDEDEDDDEDFSDDEDEDEEESSVPLWMKAVDEEPENGNPDAALAKLDTMDKNMISRQFLYESTIAAAQTKTPDYREENKIDDDDNKFDQMNVIVNDMFSVMGFEEDDIPELQEYSESLFVDRLVIERPSKKFREADFDNELTRVLKKGYAGNGGNPNAYSHTESIGRQIITQIFKGASPMVTVADVMKANKDFYLDTKYQAPVIIGIDEEGKEVKFDFLEADDVLMAGKKRSGKSYTIRSLLTQLLVFNGPDKVNFYIGDTKGAASDFFRFRQPHVKDFESDPMKIMKMLEFIVNVESHRREKLFEEAGVIKISDYHKVRPDSKDMPYLYVVIDEMVTLSTKLKEMKTKDTDFKALYDGYLNALVTMLPAYGIRLIAVPHRVTNDIMSKTASDNMTFKTTVRADESLLKETLDITPKKFGFNTPNPGDLAIKLNLVKAEPFYAKSIVPASTPEISDEIFEYQRKLWSKLAPESVKDSQYAKEHPDLINPDGTIKEPNTSDASDTQVQTKSKQTSAENTGLGLTDIDADDDDDNVFGSLFKD